MQSDTPRTDDEFSDAIKQLDLRAELAEMKKQLAEARGLYLQRNYHREQLERELAAAKAELDAMRQQRDIARREACSFEAIDRWHEANPKGILSPCAVFRIAREIAAKRGWVGLFKANEPGSPKTTAPIHREPAPTPAPPPKKCCKGGNQSC